MLNPNEYLDMLPMLAEFAKTRPDAWKKFVEERDKLSTAGQYRGLRKDMYEIKGSNVESMLSNVVAKELDIRNPNGRIKLLRFLTRFLLQRTYLSIVHMGPRRQ